MNEQTIKGKWKEIKGEIQKAWGNLSGDDLEKTKGDMKSIAGIIQQKYGVQKNEIEKKLSQIVDRFGNVKEDVQAKTAEVTENLKNQVKN